MTYLPLCINLDIIEVNDTVCMNTDIIEVNE